jgi:hypothetical protein
MSYIMIYHDWEKQQRLNTIESIKTMSDPNDYKRREGYISSNPCHCYQFITDYVATPSLEYRSLRPIFPQKYPL